MGNDADEGAIDEATVRVNGDSSALMRRLIVGLRRASCLGLVGPLAKDAPEKVINGKGPRVGKGPAGPVVISFIAAETNQLTLDG